MLYKEFKLQIENISDKKIMAIATQRKPEEGKENPL